MNKGVQVSVEDPASILLAMYPEVKLLDHTVIVSTFE